ncbi:MAG: metallophosphoesterase [Bacteroidales bacterium]|nr:metallophosphoesterase [Bacteroidales bacterium]
MKKIALILALIMVAGSVNGQKLVILHTNDSHSQIEPVRTGRNANKGGVDRRLQFIDSVKHKYGEKKVLVLDAGDYNQGTPYFTMGGGKLEVDLMNALGYEVVTLGNHEFDNGQQDLANRLAKAKYETICCNYDFSQTPLKDIIKPYTIVNRGGFKIGLVGATSYLEGVVMYSHLDGMKRLDSVSEVNKWAEYLKNTEKCDIVILLSHFGYDGGTIDKPSDKLYGENSRNVDFIIGGHSHTFIKEPLVVKNLDGKDVVIVTAGCQGVEVGELKIF